MGGTSVCPASQAAAAQLAVNHVSLAGDLYKGSLLLQRSPLLWGVWDRSLLAALEQVLWLIQWQQVTMGVQAQRQEPEVQQVEITSCGALIHLWAQLH